MNEAHDTQVREIVERLKADNPHLRLFQIVVPGREEEIFLARKAPWAEYKKLIGQVKNEADANELLVQKFLVHPKPDYDAMQNEWEPGLGQGRAQAGVGEAGQGPGHLIEVPDPAKITQGGQQVQVALQLAQQAAGGLEVRLTGNFGRASAPHLAATPSST